MRALPSGRSAGVTAGELMGVARELRRVEADQREEFRHAVAALGFCADLVDRERLLDASRRRASVDLSDEQPTRVRGWRSPFAIERRAGTCADRYGVHSGFRSTSDSAHSLLSRPRTRSASATHSLNPEQADGRRVVELLGEVVQSPDHQAGSLARRSSSATVTWDAAAQAGSGTVARAIHRSTRASGEPASRLRCALRRTRAASRRWPLRRSWPGGAAWPGRRVLPFRGVAFVIPGLLADPRVSQERCDGRPVHPIVQLEAARKSQPFLSQHALQRHDEPGVGRIVEGQRVVNPPECARQRRRPARAVARSSSHAMSAVNIAVRSPSASRRSLSRLSCHVSWRLTRYEAYPRSSTTSSTNASQ